ncbi:MAG TPA: flagellar motor switch protein FliN [Firmicutes bacterium]|nr:flagellar motor switch protein FliN [Bacillota bacterium]
MSRDLVSADEMSFLSKKNRELDIQEMLTEDVLATIHFAAQKGILAFNETLENVTKKELTSIIVDYKVENAKAFFATRSIDYVSAFVFKVSSKGGNHVLMVQKAELVELYHYLTEETAGEDLSAEQLDWILKHFTAALKNYYKRFSEELNCHIHIDATERMDLDIQTEVLTGINLDELFEIKLYEISFEMKRINMIHLSDADFIEYAYEDLETEAEHSFFESLYDENHDDLFESHTSPVSSSTPAPEKSSPVVTQGDVRKPQFATFDDQTFDSNAHNLGLLYDVPLELSVVLGKTKRSVKEVLEINTGKIIELNKYADDPLEIYVNGKLIAEGEVVVVDENFGVRVTKLFNNDLNFKTSKR